LLRSCVVQSSASSRTFPCNDVTDGLSDVTLSLTSQRSVLETAEGIDGGEYRLYRAMCSRVKVTIWGFGWKRRGRRCNIRVRLVLGVGKGFVQELKTANAEELKFYEI